MTENNNEQELVTDEQITDGNAEGSDQVENDQSADEPRSFSQEELDSILSERLAQDRERSAAELAQFRRETEETIANLSRAVTQQKEIVVDVDDDPAPANMTPNEKLLWDSNAKNRIHMKRMLKNVEDKMSAAFAPIINDRTVSTFFAARPNIPESIKKATNEIFTEAVRNGNRAPAEQIVVAAYTRALAVYAENDLLGKNKGAAGNAKPKIIVKAPNGTESTGSGTRPITGKIGSGRNSSGKTYEQLKAELIAEGKMPDNGAGGHFSR
jgi:hypothetical protein